MKRYSSDWIDAAKSKEDIQERYDEWASSYDKDLLDKWQYVLPAFIGDLFMKYVENRKASVLDAGAGTGLSGEYLKNHGYDNLFGVDASEKMMNQAKSKKIYRKLEKMFLGEMLDYHDNQFDAVLSVGTIGHAPPESFDELIRITKPSGLIIFSIREAFYNEPKFYKKLQALQELDKWILIERTELIQGMPGESDNYHYGFVYKVL